MLKFKCPECMHEITLKEPKEGRFQPACPKCTKKFGLEIQGGHARIVKLTPAASAPKAATVPDANATAIHASEVAATSDSEKTGDWQDQVTTNGSAEATGAWVESTPAPPKGPLVSPSAPTIGGGAAPTSMGEAAAAEVAAEQREMLGGYRILQELGRGAMGSVYLAQQLSLDRQVALKTIQPQHATNPVFISRFTREAYAAAQLTHHNVVQIYDMGCDRGTHYFSMEFVDGQPLSKVIKEKGTLDPRTAATYTLQAARGLAYAHENGMVHRDIKPDNLMLNRHGVVKVADLGLVKTVGLSEESQSADSKLLQASSAHTTMANTAMGTPAYMAPEQAADSSSVDQRADIYSLGCTLFVMLTGKPPFQGKTALEVITKHKMEPIVRPDALVKNVPGELSDLTVKMVAKKKDDRIGSMSDVITTLEKFLGLSAGGFVPGADQLKKLELAANSIGGGIQQVVAIWAIPAVVAFSVLIMLLGIFLPYAFGFGLALGVLTPLFHFVLSGMLGKSFLYLKAREVFLSASIGDWLMRFLGAVVLLALLWVFGWLGVWIGAGIIAAAISAGVYFAIERPMSQKQAAVMAPVDDLLRDWRMRGIEEEKVRQFVARGAGVNWEVLFEAIFGFEAKLSARELLTEDERRKSAKYAAWREPVVKWLDAKQQSYREAKQKKHLETVEVEGLKAQGLSAAQAIEKARDNAEALVENAAILRQQAVMSKGIDKAAAQAKREAIKQMLADAKSEGRTRKKSSPFAVLGAFAGAKLRFALGALLLVGFAMWAQNNQIFSSVKVDDATKVADVNAAKTAAQDAAKGVWAKFTSAKPLELPAVPGFITHPAGSIGGLVAGMLLLFSSVFRGVKMTFFMLPAVAIATVGPSFLPNLHLGEILCPAIGILLGFGALMFGRSAD